jgi:ABC-type dipeptide/oligopeptide/nickel transport system ATPase component
MASNYIIGIIGKKGSGKSYLIKTKFLKNVKRYIVIDTLQEYTQGVIFDDVSLVHEYLKEHINDSYKIIFRPKNDGDVDMLLSLTVMINNYTLIIEEVDFYADTFHINENILYNIKYGRHFSRNLVWISRSPYEINRFLTRQTDVIICFNQTEPRDIEYLNKYSFDKNIKMLEKYEYAVSGDAEVYKQLFRG